MLERFGENLPAREVKFAPCDPETRRGRRHLRKGMRACSARSISAKTW